MNKRLKELYLQAHTTRHYDGDPALEGNPPTVYWQGEVSAQRFAELIVQECANRLMQDDFGSNKGIMRIAGAKLKEHFEVKE